MLDLLGWDVNDADFGAHHDPPVVRQKESSRSQAVAVQGRADEFSVAEGQQGRTVPGLHDRTVEAVEILLILQKNLAVSYETSQVLREGRPRAAARAAGSRCTAQEVSRFEIKIAQTQPWKSVK